jgi:hypothetical protein
MPKQIHIYPISTRLQRGNAVASAQIKLPDSKEAQLFYSVPEQYKAFLTESLDPFVIAMVFKGMWLGADIHVHGDVSSSLLHNLVEFQAFWSSVHPEYFIPVEIYAESESESTRSNERAILAYSGGMDSNFSAWRHHTQGAERFGRHLSAALMVHGFDIPLEEPEMFARSLANSHRMLDSIGLEVIPLKTNFQTIVQLWILSHGAGLASALMMLRAGFGAGMIAATLPYHSVLPLLGSNPISDPLLSSDSFTILHDGAAFTRGQKARALSSWSEAMHYMRVCWEGKERDRNCCHCAKCIRTILNFRAMGLPRPACFESDVNLWQIATHGPVGRIKFPFFQEALNDARANHISGSWVTLLTLILPIYSVLLKFAPMSKTFDTTDRDRAKSA